MITLIRWIRLQQLKIKWQLALMSELDKQLMNIVKHPEEIEKKIMPYLAKLIHEDASKMMNGEGVTIK